MIDDDFDWYLDNYVVPGRPPPKKNRAQLWQQKWRVAATLAAEDESTRAAVEIARQQGLVLTHDQARSAGLTDADLRRLVRRGLWTAPRRNALCVLPRPSETGAREPHGLRPEMLATAVTLVCPNTVASNESAAAIHGLPLLRDPRRPIVTVRSGNGGGQPGVLIRTGAVQPHELMHWFGAGVTRPARTVVDIARMSGPRAGLVAADAALHDELVTPAELAAALARASNWRGIKTARRVVEIADGDAESPLESLSRLLIIDAGLPVPGLQKWVSTDLGRFRVDGLWPGRRVVLECDGMLKYVTTDDDEDDPLRAEKLRQEALERAGYRVVQVTWDDVMKQPITTLRRIVEALQAGGRGCLFLTDVRSL